MIELNPYDFAAMLMLASLAMFTIGYVAAIVVPLHRRGHASAMRRLALAQMRGMQHAFAIAPLPARWRASAQRQIAARMAHTAGHPAARR
ncbi:MAG: hypothetical protein L0H59_17640 [Tomitella sp.]|nr:hypothetical protein [Tomitella sp.]